jgi:hypothetical protein
MSLLIFLDIWASTSFQRGVDLLLPFRLPSIRNFHSFSEPYHHVQCTIVVLSYRVYSQPSQSRSLPCKFSFFFSVIVMRGSFCTLIMNEAHHQHDILSPPLFIGEHFTLFSNTRITLLRNQKVVYIFKTVDSGAERMGRDSAR